MKNIVFDLDGTLADTSGDLIAAANFCFENMGYGPLLNQKTDKLTAFHGGRAMLRKGLEREKLIFDEEVIDSELYLISRAYIPFEIIGDNLNKKIFKDKNLLEVLINQFEVKISRSDQELSAITLSNNDANLF